MDVYDAINTRRSIRSYTDDPVGPEALARIAQAGIEAPTGCNMQLRQFIIVDDAEIIGQMAGLGVTKGAPATIVILMDPQGTPYGEFWVQDASATMENMLLAAVAEGLGACWIEGQVTPKESQLRQILGVPENLRVWSIMCVGHPTSQPDRPAKPDFDEIVYFNRFGESR
ncbi:MAG: nitroreductase family protein [Planctomycetota bacterium]|jgi:nitroreductase